MNYYDLISLILTQLHERINSDEFLERFRRPNSFVRYRKLTLKQVVAYLIHSKKRSMDIELSDLQRQLPDIDFPDVSRQAVSKARKGILPDLFKELLDKLSIPIKTSTFFGNSEHSFPEKQSIPFRNRVQFIF